MISNNYKESASKVNSELIVARQKLIITDANCKILCDSLRFL